MLRSPLVTCTSRVLGQCRLSTSSPQYGIKDVVGVLNAQTKANTGTATENKQVIYRAGGIVPLRMMMRLKIVHLAAMGGLAGKVKYV